MILSNLLQSLGDVLLVDPSAAVLDQDGPEAELQGVEGSGGDTDISGNTADEDVCAAFSSYELLQAGLAQLGVVEEGGVGVDGGVDPLVHDPGLGVHLEVGVQLRAPGVLHAVPGPENLKELFFRIFIKELKNIEYETQSNLMVASPFDGLCLSVTEEDR